MLNPRSPSNRTNGVQEQLAPFSATEREKVSDRAKSLLTIRELRSLPSEFRCLGSIRRSARRFARSLRLSPPPAAVLVAQFSLTKKSFEISQPGARQLFSIILSRLPPLLQMSLKQASSFIRPMNLVVRGSVYTPSRVDSLPQQVLIRHSQPLRTRDRRQLHLLLKVSIFSRAKRPNCD